MTGKLSKSTLKYISRRRCKKTIGTAGMIIMSTLETLLLLFPCHKWNKYLCSFRIESIRKFGTSYYQSFVLGNFLVQQKWEGANREVSIINASYCQQVPKIYITRNAMIHNLVPKNQEGSNGLKWVLHLTKSLSKLFLTKR